MIIITNEAISTKIYTMFKGKRTRLLKAYPASYAIIKLSTVEIPDKITEIKCMIHDINKNFNPEGRAVSLGNFVFKIIIIMKIAISKKIANKHNIGSIKNTVSMILRMNNARYNDFTLLLFSIKSLMVYFNLLVFFIDYNTADNNKNKGSTHKKINQFLDRKYHLVFSA